MDEINKKILIIWRTAIELGFKFNESDAHYMYLKLDDYDKKKEGS